MGADGPYAHLAETHSAVLVIVGEHVYKAKKPLDLGFLDFSTVERRRQVCHREVELNRRLAPDVYLGVADVHGTDGRVCDHLVVMRRMPADRGLDRLAEVDDARLADHLRAVAATLAGFHARARRGREVDDQARGPALRAAWRSNLDALGDFVDAPLDGPALHEVDERAMRFVDGRGPLFEARIAEGRVVDGHGDLLAGDVFCLDDGPRILDCVEFDDRLRHVDGLSDAAGLVMDLDQRGHGAAAERFMAGYRELADDPGPRALLDHFVAARAVIRAKAACLRYREGSSDPAEAAAEARGLVAAARARLRRAGPRLVLVGGPPGSGKSTLAAALAERIGATVLDSDRVRKELAGVDPDRPGTDELYAPEHTERTYAALLERAGTALGRAGTVVLDASWTHGAHRERAGRVADATRSELVAIRCAVDQDTVARRASGGGRGASDAGPGRRVPARRGGRPVARGDGRRHRRGAGRGSGAGGRGARRGMTGVGRG